MKFLKHCCWIAITVSVVNAIGFQPDFAAAAGENGQAQGCIGAPDDDVDACTTLLASTGLSDEDRHTVHVRRGTARYSAGDTKGAIEDFDLALEIEPSSRSAAGARAFAYIAIGRVRQAQRDLLELISGAPPGDRYSLLPIVSDLATTSKPHRHGILARRLIEIAGPLSDDDPNALEVTAAAFAADRQFDIAVRSQFRALKLARQKGISNLDGFQARFELYKSKRALVCPDMTACWPTP